MILRARTVVTMDGAPIEDGAVAVHGHSIAAVDRWRDIARASDEPVLDLGDRVLLPGLINAHCHLDYTMMRGAISRPASFTSWIQRINSLKRSLSDDDYLRGIASGFRELKTWGTTCVFNLEAFPELLPKMPPPPIRTWWFYELIDLRQRVATDELLAGALTFFNERQEWLGGFGLNPHAPYTASADLYRLANDCARAARMPLTTHLGESADETEMFRRGSGPLFAFLQSLGRDMSDCGHGSALGRLVHEGGLNGEWILAHLNELDEEDMALLGRVRPHVVHCARSHKYFGHRPFEFRRLHALGLNISLGTDSLASNESLSLFAEMQSVQKAEPWLEPSDLLATVTTNPARAIGLGDRLGKIAPGTWADLIALPFSGKSENAYDAITSHLGPVAWMMIDGQIVTSSSP